eukprot:531509_1
MKPFKRSIKQLSKALQGMKQFEDIGLQKYYSLVQYLDWFVMVLYSSTEDFVFLSEENITCLWNQYNSEKTKVEISTIENTDDLNYYLIWFRHALLDLNEAVHDSTSIVHCYCTPKLIHSKETFIFAEKKNKMFNLLFHKTDTDPAKCLCEVIFSSHDFMAKNKVSNINPSMLNYLCYCQTMSIPQYYMYKVFILTNGLKLLFKHLMTKSLENYNLYSLLFTARFLNLIIVSYPNMSKYIFSEESKLYKMLFSFWRKYMRFYWKIKQSKTEMEAFSRSFSVLPMIVTSVKPFDLCFDHPLHVQNTSIDIFILNNKYLLLEFIMDLIANILTTTIAQSKLYWIKGHNTENIIKYLLSKTNCNFLFNWFIEQYKMNINYYKESNAKDWIEHFDDYFISHDYDSDNTDFLCGSEYGDYRNSYAKFEQLEFNIDNICRIREIIVYYYRKKNFNINNKQCGVRELFSRYRLHRALLLLRIKDMGKSRYIYEKLLDNAFHYNPGIFVSGIKKKCKEKID